MRRLYIENSKLLSLALKQKFIKIYLYTVLTYKKIVLNIQAMNSILKSVLWEDRFLCFSPIKILLFIFLKVMHLLHHFSSEESSWDQKTSTESEVILAEHLLQNAMPHHRGVMQEIHKMVAALEECMYTQQVGHEKSLRSSRVAPNC